VCSIDHHLCLLLHTITPRAASASSTPNMQQGSQPL
jgi:hypothetical protein